MTPAPSDANLPFERGVVAALGGFALGVAVVAGILFEAGHPVSGTIVAANAVAMALAAGYVRWLGRPSFVPDGAPIPPQPLPRRALVISAVPLVARAGGLATERGLPAPSVRPPASSNVVILSARRP